MDLNRGDVSAVGERRKDGCLLKKPVGNIKGYLRLAAPGGRSEGNITIKGRKAASPVWRVVKVYNRGEVSCDSKLVK